MSKRYTKEQIAHELLLSLHSDSVYLYVHWRKRTFSTYVGMSELWQYRPEDVKLTMPQLIDYIYDHPTQLTK